MTEHAPTREEIALAEARDELRTFVAHLSKSPRTPPHIRQRAFAVMREAALATIIAFTGDME
jgi:predicted SPOUT superfamily RNA methylase MTH1